MSNENASFFWRCSLSCRSPFLEGATLAPHCASHGRGRRAPTASKAEKGDDTDAGRAPMLSLGLGDYTFGKATGPNVRVPSTTAPSQAHAGPNRRAPDWWKPARSDRAAP